MNDRRITDEEVISSLINLKQLTFEVTDVCNLQCKYCGYGDLYFGYDKREAQYMSFGQGRMMIDYLADLWRTHHAKSARQRTYISFYGGEPLMNMDFITRMIAYVEQLDVPRNFIFSMTTNAMLLDRYMDYLAEKRVHLLISLDGDKEGQGYRVTHNGDNSFDRVFGNVKKLQSAYPDYFAEWVEFNSVLHNRNSVERTHNFILREFGKKPRSPS
jgi:putative dehydrogenase